MKIYTKTGDIGETSLFGGRRVSKSELRIEAYGTVDELNSWIGLLRDIQAETETKNLLKEIQDRLFTLGATLAADPENEKLKVPDLHESDIVALENAIDKYDEKLEPLRSFVLPGGHLYVSYCHVSRTVCRRAERLAVALHHTEPLHPLIVKYLNRLSDYLFTLSRKMAQDLGAEEVKWEPRK
ncbi:MAG: cob(I)yrinic acid a,c-diamide adenosyltransferase [Chitinophagales bacterium]|nr:cob(I)yrinic acid a,c-diamide adenosyltransferase [Chitinophagales bacterium]